MQNSEEELMMLTVGEPMVVKPNKTEWQLTFANQFETENVVEHH